MREVCKLCKIIDLQKELFYEIHNDKLERDHDDQESKCEWLRGLTLGELCVRV